jgi:hypothetical protein
MDVRLSHTIMKTNASKHGRCAGNNKLNTRILTNNNERVFELTNTGTTNQYDQLEGQLNMRVGRYINEDTTTPKGYV